MGSSVNISVAIMAHFDRRDHAKALKARLDRMWFHSVEIVYDVGDGEWDTGKRSLQNGIGKADWHIVLQDDAIISDTFYENVFAALRAVPQRSLVSFYLGRVKPHAYQVKTAFRKAMHSDSSWIATKGLLWGVGIAIPSEDIEKVLDTVQAYPRFWYDRRIGHYYFELKQFVYYTTISLVDHNYKLPSITKHDTKYPRVCHKFVGEDLLQYNSKYIVM